MPRSPSPPGSARRPQESTPIRAYREMTLMTISPPAARMTHPPNKAAACEIRAMTTRNSSCCGTARHARSRSLMLCHEIAGAFQQLRSVPTAIGNLLDPGGVDGLDQLSAKPSPVVGQLGDCVPSLPDQIGDDRRLIVPYRAGFCTAGQCRYSRR